MKTCPYCAESIPDAATLCPMCHMDTRGEPAADPRSAAVPPSARSNSSGIWVAVAVIVGVGALVLIPCLIALLLPAVQQAREAARRSQCRGHLTQIALALHNYHDQYNAFPPAYVADADGRPLYSWRVLILPYLEEQALYDAFDKSQPWDSPANRYVLQNAPPVFRCPSHFDQDSTNTHYAGVFGPDCLFRGADPVRIADILDGTSSTAMVGEVTSVIPWTSPEDVDVTLHPGIKRSPGFNSHHVRGVHFAMADGRVVFFDETTSQAALDAAYTRSGGEVAALP